MRFCNSRDATDERLGSRSPGAQDPVVLFYDVVVVSLAMIINNNKINNVEKKYDPLILLLLSYY